MQAGHPPGDQTSRGRAVYEEQDSQDMEDDEESDEGCWDPSVEIEETSLPRTPDDEDKQHRQEQTESSGFGEGEVKIKWRVADVEYLREEKRPKFQKENYCAACETIFTFSKRRHHCRNCGMSFCQKHSNCYTAIPKYGFDEPVRVCKGCYASMIKTKMKESRTSMTEEAMIRPALAALKPTPQPILKESAYT